MNKLKTPGAPLFRDPIFDGAADPTIIWNREEKEWWIIYTNRRANVACEGVSWVHGTDLGIASSSDGGITWNYRGIVKGLEFERGRNTFWAPEIVHHENKYHMYVSYINGVPSQWNGHNRHIVHYTSENLWEWTFESSLALSSDFVIDACIHPLPNGTFRMWYKDEANSSYTYAADSADLYKWEVTGPVITDFQHEGPNVFYFKGSYWMIIDKWAGQAVYKSDDGDKWTLNNTILHEQGNRKDDGTIGYHADVHVQGQNAYIFYFTHPDRKEGTDEQSYSFKRSSLQVAKLELVDGKLFCDRDAPFLLQL